MTLEKDDEVNHFFSIIHDPTNRRTLKQTEIKLFGKFDLYAMILPFLKKVYQPEKKSQGLPRGALSYHPDLPGQE